MKQAISLITALLFAGSLSAQPQMGNFFFGGFGGGFPGTPDSTGVAGFPGFGGGFPDFGDFGNFDMGAMMGEMPEGPTGQVDFVSTNLPLIQIFTDSVRISKQQKITARMKITDNGKGKRNKADDVANGYDGMIGIKIRGNSSAAFTQKRYTISLRNEEGKSQKASLLGMPADDDWVLLGPYNDRSMMRDAFAFDLWTEMGHWGSRSRYAEVLLNGEYRGVYLVVEKIKRSQDRVNISKQDSINGGFILRVDATDSDCATFRSAIAGVNSQSNNGGFGGGFGGGSMPVTWCVFYPKKDKLQTEQLEYIQDYVNKAEQAIADGKDYDKYIDVASFVDYFIHTELSLNADGFKRSAYFYKDGVDEKGKGGLLHAGPVWDYNLAYGNCNFCSANDIYAWVYNGCETNPTPAMWKNLAANEAFMKRVKARYAQLRKSILSEKSINAYIDQHAKLLSEAQERHFAKYYTLLDKDDNTPEQSENAGNTGNAEETGNAGFGGGFGGFGGGLGGGFGGFGGGMMGGGDTAWFDAYTPKDYKDEISILKKWFADRIAFLDSQWK